MTKKRIEHSALLLNGNNAKVGSSNDELHLDTHPFTNAIRVQCIHSRYAFLVSHMEAAHTCALCMYSECISLIFRSLGAALVLSLKLGQN